MHNDSLAADYLHRAEIRLKAIHVLAEEKSWADVVRESQEVVEITLKALLRMSRIEVPRIHDVSPVLEQNQDRLPAKIMEHLSELMRISKSLRRDRELAFYGSEDLTPSEFYTETDATTALREAHFVHSVVRAATDST